MQLHWKKLGAEFLGTMVLVVIAVGVATESFGFHLFGLSYSAGVVATALAFGLVLVALVYAIGPISGCHVNPAVTLGFIASGRMKLEEGIAYLVAQFAGGIAAPTSCTGCSPPLRSTTSRSRGWAPTATASSPTCWSARAAPSWSRWCSRPSSSWWSSSPRTRRRFRARRAWPSASALLMVHLIGIPLTGTSVNPARSLGPALVVGGTALSQVWLFIVAPLVGAIVGAFIHILLLSLPPRRIRAASDSRRRPEPGRPDVRGPGRYGRAMDLERGTRLRPGPPTGRAGHDSRQRTAAAVQHHVRAAARETPSGSRSPTTGPRRRTCVVTRGPRSTCWATTSGSTSSLRRRPSSRRWPPIPTTTRSTPGRLLPDQPGRASRLGRVPGAMVPTGGS